MVRAGAIATCAALLMLPSSAEAEPTLTERLRVQAGYTTEARPAPVERTHGLYGAAVPELVLFWARPASLISVTYQLTGTLNSAGTLDSGAWSNELSNRLILASSWDLSTRTTFLLSAEAAQTSFSTFLLADPAASSNVALFPSVSSKVLTTRVTQGLGYEMTSRLRFSQGADAGYITSIAPSPPLETFTANGNLGLEYVWRDDGVGLDLRGGYATTSVPPPSPSQALITLTGSPHWRHDWSSSISTQVAAGASVLIPTTTRGETLLSPFGRASALYLVDDTTWSLNYSVGVASSPLTGQVIRSDQVTANVTTPISLRHRVLLGASAGVLRGHVVDLTNPGNNQEYDSLLTDVDVSWQVSSFASVFARYQFLAQLGDVNQQGANPSFLRDLAMVGVQFASRPSGVSSIVPTRFPQRVDGADSRPGGHSSTSSGGSSSGGSAPPAQ